MFKEGEPNKKQTSNRRGTDHQRLSVLPFNYSPEGDALRTVLR
jgi:hypothetical protein